MAKAGFHLWGRGPRPARDRFLMVFGKAPPYQVRPEDDPMVGGPAIYEQPGEWLRQNLWRLRGLKTANGSLVPVRSAGRRGSVENLGGDSPTVQTWNIADGKLALSFRKEGDTYLLTDCRASDRR